MAIGITASITPPSATAGISETSTKTFRKLPHRIRLHPRSRIAAKQGAALPPRYYRLFWTWFAFGFPAFSAVLGIYWLMIERPRIALF